MFFSSKISLLACSFAVVLALSCGGSPSVVGGPRELKGDELKKAEYDLKNSLTKVAAGPGPVYELNKVNSATTKVVSGTLTELNVELVNSKGEKKICDVSIWSQPWLENGIEVTFECEGEEKVVRRHSA